MVAHERSFNDSRKMTNNKMKKQTIHIEGRDMTKERLTCDLCGKTAYWPNVDIYCGGPFGQLCKDCDPIVCKVIDHYLGMLELLPFRVVAGTIYKHAFKEEQK